MSFLSYTSFLFILKLYFVLSTFLFQDSCYEVRDKFAKKLHKAEDLLKLPLEYLGIFALAAPEPVKERKNQVMLCNSQDPNLNCHCSFSYVFVIMLTKSGFNHQ